MWPLEDHAQEVASFYGTVLKLFNMFLNGLHGDTAPPVILQMTPNVE